MNIRFSRTQFLRGKISENNQVVRPPWSVSESDFVDLCTRGDACVKACPENIINIGSGGFPAVSFEHGACTFCNACADACPTGAIVKAGEANRAQTSPWQLDLKISDACISASNIVCMVCKEYCDAEAIQFATPQSVGKPIIDSDLCTGCGACISPCPTQAISLSPNQGN